jgi:hypothetical protein
LNPKKVKNIIPELAKKLQLSDEQVKSVLDVYWDKVRKTLSSLEHNNINLKGLGSFNVKPWMIDKKIKMNKCIIDRYIENPTSGGLTIINNLSKDNLKLETAMERVKESNIKKENIRNERRNQNLEGEEQNS